MELGAVAAAGLALVGLAVLALVASRRSAAARARDERGKAEDSFMKRVVKVSLVVMLVAGSMVWLIDRAEENRSPDNGSETDTPNNQKPKPPANKRR